MRNYLLICIVLMTAINSYSISKDSDCTSSSECDCWKTLIYSNNIEKIRQKSATIASDTLSSRNHSFEVKLVRLAIDCLNPNALMAFYENKLGFYNPEIDDVTPLDYLFNENFDERISNAKGNPLDSEENFAERLYQTIWILMGFQDINIDESKMLEIQSKLEKYIEP